MKPRVWLAVFGWCAALARFAGAYPSDWGPFAAGQSPPRFPVAPCEQVASEGPETVVGVLSGPRVRIYGTRRTSDPRLRLIASATPDDMDVEIVGAQGRASAAPRTVPPYADHPKSIFCGDLNGDRRLDFIAPLWGHGNGLGASFYALVVALSSAPTYRIWFVPTAEPGADDFLRFPAHRDAVIVKSSFRGNGEQDDRKVHSYWVYNLIAIRGDELVVANDLDPRFPKWVWYTGRPNHKPATSLSPADKERIWNLWPERELLFTEITSAGP